jgi:hypothetical protein
LTKPVPANAGAFPRQGERFVPGAACLEEVVVQQLDEAVYVLGPVAHDENAQGRGVRRGGRLRGARHAFSPEDDCRCPLAPWADLLGLLHLTGHR